MVSVRKKSESQAQGQGKLRKAIARFTLQLEGDRRAINRTDNFVLTTKADSQLEKALAHRVEHYEKIGKSARKEAGAQRSTEDIQKERNQMP